MPTIKEVISHLKKNYKLNDVIAISIWSVDDILECADRKITKKQAEDILNIVNDNQDAELGINWDTLKEAIDYYFEDD